MSRAHKISSDLRHVAALAGTTAAVVEGAAIAADRARSVTEHFGGDAEGSAVEAVVEVARPCRARKRLLILLLVAIAAAVGIAVWKKRSAALDDDVTDLRDDDRFAGSMP